MQNIVIQHGAARETKFNVFQSVSCLDGVHHFTTDTDLGLYKVTVTDDDDNFIRRYNTQSKTPETQDESLIEESIVEIINHLSWDDWKKLEIKIYPEALDRVISGGRVIRKHRPVTHTSWYTETLYKLI